MSSAPSGSALSTTSVSLSNLAVLVTPRFETLKKQRVSRDPLLQYSERNYTSEYVGYKAVSPGSRASMSNLASEKAAEAKVACYRAQALRQVRSRVSISLDLVQYKLKSIWMHPYIAGEWKLASIISGTWLALKETLTDEDRVVSCYRTIIVSCSRSDTKSNEI